MRILSSLSVEFLGQTIASLAWAASVFTYGISSAGDWLQLLAATCWFCANMASVINIDSNTNDSTLQAKT